MLPTDLSDWPEDGFELLGVEKNSDKKTVRRAYARLIKKYKPDDHPVEFQKIRDAYEHVLDMIRFWSDHPEYNPDADDGSDKISENSSDTDEHGALDSGEANVVDDRQTELESRLQATWEKVLNGEWDGAREVFDDVRKERSNRLDPEWTARLYWLMKTVGWQSFQTDPCGLLLDALESGAFDDVLFSLLEEEVRVDPERVLGDKGACVLESGLEFPSKMEFVGLRWRSATQLKRWDIILEDMGRMREQIQGEHEDRWARCLFEALDRLAFSDKRTEFKDLMDKAQSLSSRDESIAHGQERLDYLSIVRREWGKLEKLTRNQHWANLISLAWWQDGGADEKEIVACMCDLARAPKKGFRSLDGLFAKKLTALGLIVGLFESLWFSKHWSNERQDRSLELDAKDVDRELNRLVSQTGYGYAMARERILMFCIRNHIGPATLADQVEQQPGYKGTSKLQWAESVRSDIPLRAIYVSSRYVFG